MRVAWCCKWMPPQGDDPVAAEALNLRSTTATAIAKLAPAEATAKLLAITRHNLAALQAQIAYA
ncbi:MAG TPA: UV damage endonuclease UvsE, partial [Acetobacteraceae bacterium]|nr:UV damage endonuclease UvsE [Acetobacteraceae bacterium]